MPDTVTHTTPKMASVSVVVLLCIIVFPSLPLKFTLTQMSICLLGSLSVVMAVFALVNLICDDAGKISGQSISDAGWFGKYGIECLLCLILAYGALQLIPLSRIILESISPAAAGIWQFHAYGLTGKGTLTTNISGTIWFLITWCSYCILFFLLSRHVSRLWHFVMVTLTLFSIGLYQIGFDELSKHLGYEYITAAQIDGHTYRLTGTFVNSNNVSALINLSIAAGLALMVLMKSRLSKHNAAVLVPALVLIGFGELILLYGLIKAGSAGGFLSLVLAVLLVGLFLILRQFSVKVLTGLSIFIVIMLVSLTFYGSRELNMFELRENLSLSGRPDLWFSVIQMWKDFPIFGIGAGAFEWIFPMYKSDNATPLRVFTAHSGYLHLAVELGLIGVTLILFLAVAYCRKILVILNKSEIHRHVTCSLMVGVLAFLIHECVETNLLIPPVAVLFFSVLALIMALSKLNLDTRRVT